VPLVENRGKVLLVIENTYANALAAELNQLRQDLCGDGWTIVERSCNRNDSVASVKATIASAYNQNPEVGVIFLFGHVPVPYSGTGTSLDRHEDHLGAMPSDSYYADLGANWETRWTDSSVDTNDFRIFDSYIGRDVPATVTTYQQYVAFSAANDANGNGGDYKVPLLANGCDDVRRYNVPGDNKFDLENFPQGVHLPVGIGRVDLSNMPAFQNAGGEVELLRRYLNKDHNFRHKVTVAERRGLVVVTSDFSYAENSPTATGFRNSPALFGQNATTVVGPDQYLPTMRNGSYLFSSGNGWGYYDSCHSVATTADFASAQPVKTIFATLWGSYFGDWDNYYGNNIMRAVLCEPQYGLTCVWGGRPHWYFHHMGMGETIGFSQKITQDNYDLYDTFAINTYATPDFTFRKGTHVALMGDPTLRLHPVAPPANFSASSTGQLTWSAPVNESILGFNVYRATSAYGPFTKLNTNGYVTTTNFTDAGVTPGSYTYMVRAIKLETGSGTYVNASQGVFNSVTISNKTNPTGSLVGWWKMDEGGGATAYDASGYNHNGTYLFGPTSVAGKNGAAEHFDGVDDTFIVDSVDVNTAAGGSNTVAFWMKWEGADNQMPFAWNTGYDLYLRGGLIGINTAEGNCLGCSSAGLANNWVHVAVIFPNGVPNSSNTKIYLNGVAQPLQNANGVAATQQRSATWRFFLSGWNTAGYKFGGSIDDVRIYNYGLSASEVAALYSPSPAATLMGWWKMDEGGGTTAYDASGYNHNGTYLFGPTSVAGKIGAAEHFDGVDDTFIVDSVDVNTAAGGSNTVAFWMKWEGTDNQMPFAWNSGYDLYLRGSMIGINTAEGNCLGCSSAGLANNWVHVAVVFPNGIPNSSNTKIYLNGVAQPLQNANGVAATQQRSATWRLFLSGWNTAGYKFGGSIDDLRVFNGELSAGEVSGLYAASAALTRMDAPSMNGIPNAAPNAVPMTITRLSGAVTFGATGKDSCTVSAILPNLPAGFSPAGMNITLDISGAAAAFTLDAKGRAKSTAGSVALRTKMARNATTKKLEFQGGNGSLQAKLVRGSLSAAWASKGLNGTARKDFAASFTTTIELAGAAYSADSDVLVSVSEKAGRFKK
jgi:hypothetical protein